jgi:hypothetical protein
MPAESQFDPYRTPALPDSAAFPASRGGRPGWLTAVCVIAIVIGILGFFNGVFGLIGAIFGEALQSAISPTAGSVPPGMEKIQTEFQDQMNAVQKEFFVALLSSAVLRTIIALLLLVGGVMCLNLKEQGRQLLVLGFVLALLFEIGNTVLNSLVNMEVMTAVNAYVEALAEELPATGGPPPQMLIGIMKGSIIFGFVIQYLIVLIKLGFYAFGLIYLQRQAIRALFANSAAAVFAPIK